MQVLTQHTADLRGLRELCCIGCRPPKQGTYGFYADPVGLPWETVSSLRGLTRIETAALLPPGVEEHPVMLGRKPGQDPSQPLGDPSEMPPGLQKLNLTSVDALTYLPSLATCLAKVSYGLGNNSCCTALAHFHTVPHAALWFSL